MINKIKNSLNTENQKIVLLNFYFLSILQVSNIILPFITMPYLMRVLGVEYFGLLAFATAITVYFNILTDYGFNLTGTRDIAIHKQNREKIIEIFSSILTIKMIFMLISFLILISLILFSKTFSKDWEIYVLTFGTVIGQILFPIWFFQGMEKMQYITYLSVGSKVIFTFAIFIFVHQESDYYLVPLLNSVGGILVGIWSLFLIKKDFSVSFKFQRIHTIITYIRNSWHIFLSQMSVTLFGNSSIVILGLVSNHTMVGYYSASEKLIRGLAMIQTPLTRALFPSVAKSIKSNKSHIFKQLKRISLIGGGIYLIIAICVISSSQYIIELLYGDVLKESVDVLKILAIVPFMIFLNNIFGTQIMLNTGREKEFSKILFKAAFINIILCFVLSYYFSYIGTSISLVLVEFYIVTAMFLTVKKEIF